MLKCMLKMHVTNAETFFTLQCAKEQTQASLKMAKEMLWCCICNIFLILLSKIYGKKAIQSPFLGLKMLWPLGMMPVILLWYLLQKFYSPPLRPGCLEHGLNQQPEQRQFTGKEQGSNISTAKLQQLSNQEMFFPRVYVFLSFLYVFLWFILSFPKHILTGCLSWLEVLWPVYGFAVPPEFHKYIKKSKKQKSTR